MSQVVDFLNEAKTYYLQPLKETSQGSDRLVQPWRGMARSILVQPIRKKFISSYWQIQRWKSQVWQKENGFGSPAKP